MIVSAVERKGNLGGLYQIGPVQVRLLTDLPDVAAAYEQLYAPFALQDDGDDRNEFTVRVSRRRSLRSGVRHYHIDSDIDESFTVRRRSRILPHIEGAVNLCIARLMPRYLLLHAAALTRGNAGVILPGGPGFGKSTLCAALIARGWRYASDEFAMIDPDCGDLLPYPKALSIKAGAVDPLRQAGVSLADAPIFDRADKGAIRLVPCRMIRTNSLASIAQIRLIVFPMFEDGACVRAEPLSRAEAVFEMARRCFNLL